jgi:hypothetical protein
MRRTTDKIKRTRARKKVGEQLPPADQMPIAYSADAARALFIPKLNNDALYEALRDGRLKRYQVTATRSYVLRTDLIRFVLSCPQATEGN